MWNAGNKHTRQAKALVEPRSSSPSAGVIALSERTFAGGPGGWLAAGVNERAFIRL